MSKIFFAWVMIALCFAFGCGKRLDTQVVEGVVLFEGKPLENACVGFSPLPSGAGTPAFGRTDAEGKFQMTSTRGGDVGGGATAGKYAVSVTKEVPVREWTEEERKRVENMGPPPIIPVQSSIPAYYSDPDRSGLTAEVVRGKNRFDFELKSDK